MYADGGFLMGFALFPGARSLRIVAFVRFFGWRLGALGAWNDFLSRWCSQLVDGCNFAQEGE